MDEVIIKVKILSTAFGIILGMLLTVFLMQCVDGYFEEHFYRNEVIYWREFKSIESKGDYVISVINPNNFSISSMRPRMTVTFDKADPAAFENAVKQSGWKKTGNKEFVKEIDDTVYHLIYSEKSGHFEWQMFYE